jgi:diaminopimelate epimerase
MEFTKMHGLGNDFILLNGFERPLAADVTDLAVRLCDRRLGVGGDGLILVLPSEKAAARMRIINSDGSEAEMCGNGIRCFAKYVYDRGLVRAERFTVETLAGPVVPELQIEAGRINGVRVDMGRPGLERSLIPMEGPSGPVIDEPLAAGGETYRITSLLLGVPHTMVFVGDAAGVDRARIGPLIERHPAFPRRTNVNFVEAVNDREILVRTWERGAGATLACGTGSCAAAVAAVLTGRTGRRVTVHLEVGNLLVEWDDSDTVYMTGPAVEVFNGQLTEG